MYNAGLYFISASISSEMCALYKAAVIEIRGTL